MIHRPFCHFLRILICFFTFSVQLAFAKDRPLTKVYVGIYVNRIYDFSLKDNKFFADFYIWFRWKGSHVNPMATFEVADGKIEAKESVTETKSDGFNYSYARINAAVYQKMDTARFPLDNHRLRISIEDTQSEDHKLVYIPDEKNTKISNSFEFSGYQIDRIFPEKSSRTYESNFGDLELPTNHASTYSQVHFQIDISRIGFGYFFKLYWGIYLSALVSLLAFYIRPTDLDPRFGLGIGALFALMANIFVVSGSLPDNGELTVADLLNIFSVSVVCLTLLLSTISLKFFEDGQEELSETIDKVSFAALLSFYALGSWLVIKAFAQPVISFSPQELFPLAIFVMASALWVFVDARKAGVLNPGKWSLATLTGAGLIIYLYKRADMKVAAEKKETSAGLSLVYGTRNLGEIEKLAELKAKGLLTEEEFEAGKKKILAAS